VPESSSYISITLYDMSGAPLSPFVLHELEQAAERIVKYERQLALTVVTNGQEEKEEHS
jgi:hypothetical protein